MWYLAIALMCMIGSTIFVSYCFLFDKWEFKGYYKRGNVENLLSYLGAGLVLSGIWPITMFISALVFTRNKLEKRREHKRQV